MPEMIRLLLIEDHEMVRAGFRMLLDAQPDMEIVGEADRGATGIEMAKSIVPDVVLLDISMPGLGGTETARQLKGLPHPPAVLAVTIYESQAYLLEMLDAGVDGYLPKRAAAHELVNAIRTVHAGKSYVYPELVDALIDGYRDRDRTLESPSEQPVLTARQRQVLALIADGHTSQRVAERLGLSARTVDRHVENMMRRLGIHSRVELVAHALRHGLIKDLRQE